MSALMLDVIEGRIAPGTCNAACNAGGKMLKIVEMQARYGTQQGEHGKELMLAAPVKG